MESSNTGNYPLFEAWYKTLNWILDVSEKYPKSVRFSLTDRIINLGMDVLEGIVEAIYAKERLHILSRNNLYMEKLRVLFRLSYERRYISQKQYAHISGRIDEAGKMTGGWIKSCGG